MPYQTLADMVVVIHLLFILFVLFGGLLLLIWRRLIWLHLAAVIWGVAIELLGWICPLTPLENWLRLKSLSSSYEAGFVEHYLIPIIYPQGLSREMQWVFAAVVIGVNALIYILVLRRRKTSAPDLP